MNFFPQRLGESVEICQFIRITESPSQDSQPTLSAEGAGLNRVQSPFSIVAAEEEDWSLEQQPDKFFNGNQTTPAPKVFNGNQTAIQTVTKIFNGNRTAIQTAPKVSNDNQTAPKVFNGNQERQMVSNGNQTDKSGIMRRSSRIQARQLREQGEFLFNFIWNLEKTDFCSGGRSSATTRLLKRSSTATRLRYRLHQRPSAATGLWYRQRPRSSTTTRLCPRSSTATRLR